MLICEDMFILLTRADGTQEELLSDNEAALRSSLLTELLLGGYITAEDSGQLVAAETKPEHSVLAWSWETLRKHEPNKLRQLLRIEATEWFNAREVIALNFRERGQLEIHKAKWWQLSGDRYVMTDPQPKRELQKRLADVLQGNRAVNVHDLVLLNILDETEGAYSLLKRHVGDMHRREVHDRIQRLNKEAGHKRPASLTVHEQDEDAGVLVSALTALVLGFV